MSRETLSPQEVAVNQHLAEAQDRITVLEWQLNNLPADKGPELKPSGGSVATHTRGERKLELEKQIAEVKEAMLKNVERELADAPPDLRERSNLAVDTMLYGDQKNEAQKDIGASQAHASSLRRAYRERITDRPLDQGERKTLDQSQRHAYRTRYQQDTPEPVKVIDGKEERDKGTELDQTQERAYRLRYTDNSDRAVNEREQKDVGKDSIEPDKY